MPNKSSFIFQIFLANIDKSTAMSKIFLNLLKIFLKKNFKSKLPKDITLSSDVKMPCVSSVVYQKLKFIIVVESMFRRTKTPLPFGKNNFLEFVPK